MRSAFISWIEDFCSFLQTFLKLSARGVASTGDVPSLHLILGPKSHCKILGNCFKYYFHLVSRKMGCNIRVVECVSSWSVLDRPLDWVLCFSLEIITNQVWLCSPMECCGFCNVLMEVTVLPQIIQSLCITIGNVNCEYDGLFSLSKSRSQLTFQPRCKYCLGFFSTC